MEKLKAIIVDLDGTLADVEHRVEFVKQTPINWKDFNDRMIHDPIYLWCFELIHAMKDRGYKIIFITGRGEDYRSHTLNWLLKNQVQFDELYMRKPNDQREDADVKEEIYFEHVEKRFQVLFVVDDRKSVVARWRELELICLQCAWGDF
jgi:phosphoglycolate phosphatase-like HAD superfamily hydrolase